MRKHKDRYRRLRRLKSLRITFSKAYRGHGTQASRVAFRAARKSVQFGIHNPGTGFDGPVGDNPFVQSMKDKLKAQRGTGNLKKALKESLNSILKRSLPSNWSEQQPQ